jgi:nondiscriminating glutamyl-tRNA synthetase
MNESMKVRFPPSPTGHLHVGNVRTALYNWLLARRHGGTFLLRIEDTDVERSTRENEEKLLDDLRWLGLEWDEGPAVGGPNGPYRQSERLDVYKEHIDRLLNSGACYQCFCTAEELEAERQKALAEKRPPRYSGKCRDVEPEEAKRRMEAGEPAAIRFRVDPGDAIAWDDFVHGPMRFEREVIGDFLFVRSDGTPAYNFAVTVDDALMGITHVLRGDDHISNTPRQILLYMALGFDLPRFGHLPMILGPDGSRLSKRHGATSVQQFRELGYLPGALLNFLALLGWNPGDEREIFSRDELIAAFSLDRVNKSAATFNPDKLDWMNGQIMRAMPPSGLLPHVEPFLSAHGLWPDAVTDELRSWYVELVDTFNGGSRLTEIAESARLAFEFNPSEDLATEEAEEVLAEEGTIEVIRAFDVALQQSSVELTADSFKILVKQVGKETGARGKGLFHPVRLAITGKTSGPELGKLVPLLERGANLPLPKPVLPVRGRARMTAEYLES